MRSLRSVSRVRPRCSLLALSPLAAGLALSFVASAANAQPEDDREPQSSAEERGERDERTARGREGRRGRHDRDRDAVQLDTVHVTAETIARQSLGASTITAEDIERHPPVNDLSELLRMMPGVNLTGNSASGQYGNNRQIDLRGMGPENTLVLIDGRRVQSRDSIRMGRSGERNTRGDTNWVPANAVERIEVLRGPAAARYGSGASGGVINIITKKPGREFDGSVSYYSLYPEHDEEGDGQRISGQISGPVAGDVSFRVYASFNETDADSLDLNAEYAGEEDATPPAGREGVQNKDINGLLRWDVDDRSVLEAEGGFSRQGNIYAGDRAVSGSGSDLLTQLANEGAETNIMYRRSAALTYRGDWAWGTSRLTTSYEHTDNTRLSEGLAGGGEGSINSETEYVTSELVNWTVDGEYNTPLTLMGLGQVLTAGFEFRDNQLDDPHSVSQGASSGGGIPGIEEENRSGKNDDQTAAVFIEDSIYVTERLILAPGLRYDDHSLFGGQLSPSLNAQFQIAPSVTIKGGIAQAFKAPNLYQSNPNYLYYTRGNGCPVDYPSLGSGCYILGNEDLEPETSLNKEIGVEWAPATGWHASLAYFHNDYEDKIVAGMEPVSYTVDELGQVFRWTNAPEAVIEGMEGAFNVPLLGERGNTLRWLNNLTYMIRNENTETGQPLSVIPEYTLNSTLDWQPNDTWSFLLIGTFYGDQESATQSTTSGEEIEGDVREAYDIWELSARYRATRDVSFGFGVNNLFDERLFREANNNTRGDAGAATYNEPGRAYFVSATVGF